MEKKYAAMQLAQAGQPIPGYFSGNDNCHSKDKKSSENKMERLEDPTFATLVCKVHFEKQNGDQKAYLSSENSL